ncbi:MAG: hypothetical protein A3A43_03145 [Candidatus Liptonbacteria bacterium RIFCSPLOWO2_01_FULL_56_20]|uniref:RNA polymerase subunit sigma-70 n=1 Tax=Candidatus Liptonbacteria bacterium RIFCSPLOWO2_01_FULL_56_20 TaxID=1798652 RepID=A0A1G2CGV7_9BACT|nr:MAG: hypothetical protein A3A43_03145 [Candidatus Liptonbacteria bacterium RIFCSPLOWO2_01_FULL_56_20]
MIDGERTIIENAIKGEASAFGLLYDHYQPKIYRFVIIKVGQREEAEDLTHQVFLSAWQNIRDYEDIGFPFSSWLYRIARNAIIDYYRTKKNPAPLEAADAEQYAPDTLAERTDQAIELQKVRRAIQELSPLHQDIVIMRFVEELSLREIAAALGKSEGAVKLLQHRAIKQLKNLLAA